MMQQWFWIGGQRVTREEMDTTKVAYVQGLLRLDYQRGVRPHCLCKTPGIDMVVRHLNSRYILAKMPESGLKHHPDFESFNPLGDLNGVGNAKNYLPIRDKNGIARLSLTVSLTETPETLTNAPRPLIERSPSEHRYNAQTTLLGLLHHAWNEAGLNRWHPNMQTKRGWWTIHRLITEYSTSVYVSRKPLADLLYIPEPFYLDDRQRQRDTFQKFMQHYRLDDHGTRHCGLIIGEMAGLTETPYGGRVALKHLKEFPLWLGKESYNNLTRRFNRAIKCIGEINNPVRIIGIFVTHSGKDNQRYYARTGALMMVSEQWIPIDSSYEREIADALVTNERHFLKPLRFDSQDDVVFPDFLLLDSHSVPLPMEIYGMTGNADYEVRKRKKIAYYEQTGNAFWHWDVAEEHCWPPFPKPKQ